MYLYLAEGFNLLNPWVGLDFLYSVESISFLPIFFSNWEKKIIRSFGKLLLKIYNYASIVAPFVSRQR